MKYHLVFLQNKNPSKLHFVLNVTYRNLMCSIVSTLFPDYLSLSFEVLKCQPLLHWACIDQVPIVSALPLRGQPELKHLKSYSHEGHLIPWRGNLNWRVIQINRRRKIQPRKVLGRSVTTCYSRWQTCA